MALALIFLLFFLIFLGINYWHSHFSCDSVEYLDSSVNVTVSSLPMLGFTTETDSLKFGKISPQGGVRREVFVTHSTPAKLRIEMESEFASWIDIDPAETDLIAGESKSVAFVLNVPAAALPGDYSGRVKFCFLEK